ncbi:MAG TPA: hypothetical protein VFE33_33120 [Thermoanaerobaculia bacterium]|nr:hypothetical protein [Thermoanaerobaculia bacterium]
MDRLGSLRDVVRPEEVLPTRHGEKDRAVDLMAPFLPRDRFLPPNPARDRRRQVEKLGDHLLYLPVAVAGQA